MIRRSLAYLLFSFIFALIIHAGEAPKTPAPPADPKVGMDFFEKNIRPVLVAKCYECHSAEAKESKKLKADFFADTREGLLSGGESGPAVVPGQPAKGNMMKALRHTVDDMKMPPKEKLPDDVIANFEKWIEMGAPDPRDGAKAASAKRVINVAEGRQWWSFRPLQNNHIPIVKNVTWSKNPIDCFIAAKHEAAGFTPSAEVSRDKWLRRVYYDLIGLPPTPEQVAAFIADTAPNASEKVVDQLLASERYGERWARHWLDVARYAESGGYEFDGYRNGAYHYRDWAIRAFNADMPYNEFIRAQLAADKLHPNNYEAAAATGFLVAGPYPGQTTVKTLEKIRYDQIDDMVSTIGSSKLGLTMGCVRCHDHKYDPLPQKDYYGIAAALSRTVHGDLKIDRNLEDSKRKLDEYEKSIAPLREALKKIEESDLPAQFEAWRKDELPKLAAKAPSPWQVYDSITAEAKTAHIDTSIDGLVLYISNKSKDDLYTIKTHSYQAAPRAFRLDAFADKSLPSNGPGLSDNGNFVLGDFKVVAKPLDSKNKSKPVTLKLTAHKATWEQSGYNLSAAIDNSPTSGWAVDPQQGKDHSAIFGIEGDFAGFPGGTSYEFQLRFSGHFELGKMRLCFCNDKAIADINAPADSQSLREIQSLLAKNGDKPIDPIRSQLVGFFRHNNPKAAIALKALNEKEKTKPRPETTDVYSTKDGGSDVYFLRRGEVDNKDGKAAPNFIQVLGASAETKRWIPEAKVDPRIGLANWMTDAEHGAGPLLARVMVNRVWKHHFGRGIVGTPNDFGAKGEAPTHPELLDYLATEFIKNGWHLKPLHRAIVLSAAYRLGADASAENLKRDPDNKLLWQRPARRLEAEAIRDALLAIGGKLDIHMYGPAINEVESPRRSVYLRVRRSELVPFMTLFDAPEPTQSIGDRGATTVPTQALTMMNSPFVRDMAGRLGKRVYPATASFDQALDAAYSAALSRPPTLREREKMSAFYKKQEQLFAGETKNVTPQIKESAFAETCVVLLALNEFVYVD